MGATPNGEPAFPSSQAFADGCARVVIGWLVGVVMLVIGAKLGPPLGIDAAFRVPAVVGIGGWEAVVLRCLAGVLDPQDCAPWPS
jgi:hypothetical protein